MLKRVRHARRVQDVPRPLFPGYMFVRVRLDTMRWRPMLAAPGVRELA